MKWRSCAMHLHTCSPPPPPGPYYYTTVFVAGTAAERRTHTARELIEMASSVRPPPSRVKEEEKKKKIVTNFVDLFESMRAKGGLRAVEWTDGGEQNGDEVERDGRSVWMREEADERTDERDYKRRREKDTQRRAAAFSVCGAFFFCRLPSAFVLEPPSLLRPKGIFGVCFNRSRLAESTILLLLFKPHWKKKKKRNWATRFGWQSTFGCSVPSAIHEIKSRSVNL